MPNLKENKVFLFLLLLAGLGLAILVITALYLNRSTPALPQIITPKVTFGLSSDQTNLSAEDQFTVTVNLANNGQKVTAADAQLLFNPNLLGVIDIAAGSVFAQYPNLKLANPGEVLITGVNTSADQYAPDGVMATIKFQVKKEALTGQTTIEIGRQSVAAFEGKNYLNFSQSQGVGIVIQ